MLNLDICSKDKLSVFIFILAGFYLFFMSYIGFSKLGLLPDEVYSLGLVKLSLKDMFYYATVDVHPVLYYLLVKCVAKLCFYNNLILVGRFVSLLPFYLLFILALTKIRKDFGLLTAALFSLSIVSMPQLMVYGVMIRMYGWAIFFLTCSVVFVYDILKEPSIKGFLVLTLVTIASTYTHYFSAIASGVIYILFLSYILRFNKDLLKKWFFSVLCIVLAYIPWIPSLIAQVTRVKGDYWIESISASSFIDYIFYICSPCNVFATGNDHIAPTVLGIVLFICLIIIVFIHLFQKKNILISHIFQF